MKKNIYAPAKAVIKDVIDETPAIKTFVLKTESAFRFAAGQFI